MLRSTPTSGHPQSAPDLVLYAREVPQSRGGWNGWAIDPDRLWWSVTGEVREFFITPLN